MSETVPVEGLLKKVTIYMDNEDNVPAAFERLRQFVNANLEPGQELVPEMKNGWDETAATELKCRLEELLENPIFSGIMGTYNLGLAKGTAKRLAKKNLKGLTNYFQGDSYPGDKNRDNMDDLFDVLKKEKIEQIFVEAKAYYDAVEKAQKAALEAEAQKKEEPEGKKEETPSTETKSPGPETAAPENKPAETQEATPPVEEEPLTEEEKLRDDITEVQIALGVLVPKVQQAIYKKIEAAKAEGGALVGFLGFLNEGVDMHIPMPDNPPNGELTEKTQQSIMALSDAIVAGLQVTAGDDPTVKYSQKTKYRGGFTQEFIDKAVAQYPRRVRDLGLENPEPPEKFREFLEKILKIKKATEDQATDFAILHGHIPENLSSQEGADAFLGQLLLPIFEAIFPWFKGMFAYVKQKAGDLFKKVDGAFENKFGRSISQLAGLEASDTNNMRLAQQNNSRDMGTAPPGDNPDAGPGVDPKSDIDLFAAP